ncbi:hypothetical protein QBC46DRAFT_417519 [Diplogelasinospora grovesii]|uniref:Uncharacterized protein n=1 Tax=Diplogelasinospora grovesii TaxID=303347 RepID=A0AAN6N404_9PEZI|nr:hypothetical protein QBC46DRAFT_417519 [Diplogelasinospora grovesii]
MPCPTTTSTLDVPAVLAAVFPVDSGDGQILVVGKRCADAVNNPMQSSEIRAVNCRQPTETRLQAACSRWNVGGCGQAFLGDGRLLLAGAAADGSEPGLGHRKCASYTATSTSFTETANLGQNEEADGGEKRLTLCTLGTGELLALDGACGKSGAERYQPLTDRWVQLPKGCPQSSTGDRHLRCHLLPDGDLFIPSPFASNGYCTRMDPWTGAAQTAAVYLPDPGYWAGDLPSVLLPLVPGNNYMPRILVCGQYPSQLLDFNYPTWHWQAVPRAGPMAMVRRPGSCATLLPTGQVLLTGGKAAVPTQTELYHPPFNAATQSHNYGTGSWETLQSTPIPPNDQSGGCLALSRSFSPHIQTAPGPGSQLAPSSSATARSLPSKWLQPRALEMSS